MSDFSSTIWTPSDKMTRQVKESVAMNRVESLIGVIRWLARRDWGLALLLAVASGALLQAISHRVRYFDVLLVGPVFQSGFHIGTMLFPDYRTQGTYGFYLVPLFGFAANLAIMTAVWFCCILSIRWLKRPAKDIPIG